MALDSNTLMLKIQIFPVVPAIKEVVSFMARQAPCQPVWIPFSQLKYGKFCAIK
jgi:hypothetical protein